MNTNKNTITPFLFGESHIIRSTIIDFKPWFVAKDLCECLGLTNPTMVLNSLEDCEKITLSNSEGNPRAGIPHELNYVSESGLYAIIFKSRKKEAIQFRMWVTNEVLPSIRRTGSYHRGSAAFLMLIEDQLRLGVSPDLAARLASKLTGIPKDEYLGKPAKPQNEQYIDLITSLMQPGVAYTVDAIFPLLPGDHPLMEGSNCSKLSRIGKVLSKAAAHGRLEKVRGRHGRYRLPAIARFPGASDG